MTQTPRAILFDLDGTLLAEGQRLEILRQVADEFAEHFDGLENSHVVDHVESQYKEFWSDGERHKEWRQRPLVESRRHIAARAFAKLRAAGAAHMDEPLAHAFGERFHHLRQSGVACFPDATETLAEFRRRGVAMALVTNGAAEAQRGKIARWELGGYFDHIQIEGEAGFGKPEDQAYHHALQALGAAPHETWMVGDNLEWEVAAPQRLGIFSIWFDPYREGLPSGGQIFPDRIIHSLSELLTTV